MTNRLEYSVVDHNNKVLLTTWSSYQVDAMLANVERRFLPITTILITVNGDVVKRYDAEYYTTYYASVKEG